MQFIKRFGCCLVLLLLFNITEARAQDITGTTCPGAGCVDRSVIGQGSVGIQITGSWTGTITFSGSVNGTTFTTLTVFPTNSTTGVTTTTANGIWTGGVAGLSRVRVAFTSGGTGIATVSWNTAQAKSGNVFQSDPGSGTVTSVGLEGPDIFTYGSAVTSSGNLTFTPTDPGSDELVFWDDSAGKWQYLTLGSNITIVGTTINSGEGGAPGGSNTQVQFNDAGGLGGASVTYAADTLSFISGGGVAFAGPAAPITIKGGNDGFGDTQITVDNTTDHYVVMGFPQTTDIFGPGTISFQDGVNIFKGGSLSGEIFLALGTTPSVDDTSGGNSCGASGNPSMVSGSKNLAWEFNVGAGGGTSCTITFTVSATNKWICAVNNETTGNLVRATNGTSTTIDIVGVLTAADVINGVCFAR